MKLLLATALLLCLTGTFAYRDDNQDRHVDKHNIFTSKNEYRYNYIAQVLTGIPDVSHQQAGLGLKGHIVVKAYSAGAVSIQIERLNSGTVNKVLDTVDSEEVPFEFSSIGGEGYEALFVPMMVTYRHGMVQSFETVAGEPEEVTNIKKSILDMLQLKLDEHLRQRSQKMSTKSRFDVSYGHDDTSLYNVMEQGIEGTCKNQYTVEVNPWAGNPDAKVLNATKVLDMSQCVDYVDWLVSTHPANNCTNCDSDDIDVVSNVKIISYDVHDEEDRLVIERIDSLGQTVYSPLSANADEIQTNHSQSLILVSVRSFDGHYVRPSNTTRIDTLKYKFPKLVEGKLPTEEELINAPTPFLPLDTTDILSKARRLILEIANEINDNAEVPMLNTPFKAQQLARAIAHLHHDDIQEIFGAYVRVPQGDRPRNDYQKILKEVALAGILMSGSLPAMSVLVDKVDRNEVSYQTQLRIMHDIPFYTRVPAIPLLRKILKMAQSNKFVDGEQLQKTTWMSFASLVDQACGPDDSSLPTAPGIETLCTEEEESQFVKAIGNQLDNAKNKEQRVLFVNALNVITSEHVIDVLREYVNGNKPDVSEMVRVMAIRAISSSSSQDPNEVLRLVAPIFSDSDETSILRIAAFKALVQTAPDEHALEKLAAQMSNEEDDQLVSFVYNALDNWANTSHPCLSDISSHATHALSFIDDVATGIQDSQLFINDDYNEDLMLGNILRINSFANNESLIPNMLQVEFNRSIAGFSQVPLKVTANIEGLSSVIQRIIGPKGSFDLPTFEKIIRKSYQEQPKDYQEIFSKLQIDPRVDEPLAIAIETQILTTKRDLFYVDAPKLLKMLSQGLSSRDLPRLMSEGIKLNFHRIFNMGTVKYQMPSSLGLPIFVEVKSPSIIKLIGQLSVNVEKGQNPIDLPRKVTVHADLKPTVSLNIMTTMGVIDPFHKQYVAAGVSSKTYLRLPANIDLEVDLIKGGLSTIVKPQLSQKGKINARVFSHKVKPFTTIYKYDAFDTIKHQSKPIIVNDILDEYHLKLDPEYTGIDANLTLKTDMFWQDQASLLKYLMEENTPLSLVNFWWATKDLKHREYVARVNAVAADKVEFKMDVDLTFALSPIQQAIMKGRQSKLQGLMGFIEGWSALPWQCNMLDHVNLAPQYNNQDKWTSNDRSGPQSYASRALHTAERIATSYQTRGGVSRWGVSRLGNQESSPIRATSTVEKMDLTPRNAKDILQVDVVLRVQGIHTREINSKLTLSREKISANDKINLLVNVINPAFSEDRLHQICAIGEMSYPKSPCDIANALIPTKIGEIKGKLSVHYGQVCTGNNQIEVEAHFSKTEQQIAAEAAGNEWVFKQCRDDFELGRKLSDVCEQAVLSVSELNKAVININYNNLPRAVYNISSKVDNFLKYYFYNHMSNNPVGVDNGEGKLRVKVIFDKGAPSASLKLYKRKENTVFNKINYPSLSTYIQPISVRQSWLRRSLDQLTNGYTVPTCKLMHQHIESFDNVTYGIEMKGECMHVLAKDCAANDLFSVLIGSNGVNKNKILEIHLLEHKIEIQPKGASHTGVFEIKIDGKHSVIDAKEILLVKSNKHHGMVIATIIQNGDKIVVSSHYKQLRVKFDGENVKVQVGNAWRGSVCGMCGEFEGDSSNALIGPKMCEYASTKDFTQSYLVKSSSCQAHDSPNKLCPNQQSLSTHQGWEIDDEILSYNDQQVRHENNVFMDKYANIPHDPNVLTYSDQAVQQVDRVFADSESDDDIPNTVSRNIRMRGTHDLCFSIIPVPQCEEGFIVEETSSRKVPFHCFKEEDRSYAESLAAKMQRQPLDELTGTEVSFTRTVITPTPKPIDDISDLAFGDDAQDMPMADQYNELNYLDVPNTKSLNVQATKDKSNCFTTVGLPHCYSGFKKDATDTLEVPFHCIDNDTELVRKLEMKRPNERLFELDNQRRSMTIKVMVIKSCISDEIIEYNDQPHSNDQSNIRGAPKQSAIDFEYRDAAEIQSTIKYYEPSVHVLTQNAKSLNLQGKDQRANCFSTVGVPHCLSGFEISNTSVELVPFYCIRNDDALVKKLADRRPNERLYELEKEYPSIIMKVRVITECNSEEIIEYSDQGQASSQLNRAVKAIPNAVQRNRVLTGALDRCFSTNSYPKCRDGFRGAALEVVLAPFHCFPPEDIGYVNQLRAALPNRELTELIGTEENQHSYIVYPGKCIEKSLDQNDEDQESKSLADSPIHPALVERNVRLSVPNELCFSTISVDQCPLGAKPQHTENQRLPFHCFEQHDISYVNQLAEALPNRPLTELSGTSVSMRKTVAIPTLCSLDPNQQRRRISTHGRTRNIPNAWQRNTELQGIYEWCFTTQSYPKCVDGFVADETTSETVPFHCFPEEDRSYARQLRAAIDKRELTELNGTEANLLKELNYPTSCVEDVHGVRRIIKKGKQVVDKFIPRY